MSVQLRSFVVGSVIALVLLGVAYLVFAGDDDGPGGSRVTAPTATPVPGQAQVPTTIASRPTAAGTSSGTTTPGASNPPSTGTPATSTPAVTPSTPGSASAATSTPQVAIRTNCAQIRGTDYRSEAERLWFLENCQVEETPVTTATMSPGVSATAGPEQPPFVQAPAESPFVVAYRGLVQSFVGVANDLNSRLATPDFTNSEWVAGVRSSAAALKQLDAVTASLPTEPCLTSAHGRLRISTIEFDLASDLALSALQLLDASLFRLAQQRLNSGLAGLSETAALLVASQC